MDDKLQEAAAPSPASRVGGVMGGAFGAGLVLVVLPSLTLIWKLRWLAENPAVGLPIVAVFGIMILLGALALVSTLFARLQLDNKAEALALPAGSIRAFIALALIVLFALISVMLFESLGQTHAIPDLSEADKVALLKDPINHVSAVVPHPCMAAAVVVPAPAASAPTCTPGTTTYTVHLLKSRGTESADLSKQLLILIGTLMTSVVSFYFASRAGEANTKNIIAALTGSPQVTSKSDASKRGDPGGEGATVNNVGEGEDHLDGCNVPVVSPTADKDLPPSTGGVSP